MSKLVANVFKIIIITVLIGVFATLFACVFDVFTAIDRIDSVAHYASYDIARNNSLQYGTYMYLDTELHSISSRSSFLKVYNRTNSSKIQTWAGATDKPGVVLAVSNSDDGTTRYIQTSETKHGVLVATERVSADNTTKYQVANYGDIMCLKVQAQVRPTSWIMRGNLADSGWFNWAKFDLILQYEVPALEYIKG